MRRKISLPILVSLAALAAVWVAIHIHPEEVPSVLGGKLREFMENEILLLLIEIGLILSLSRAMGLLFARMRQPQVVGEMVAGIMLGPSLLGLISHGALQHALFPAENIKILNILSQLGVIFFLFLVGLELDPKHLGDRGASTVITAASSIIAPFFMGLLLTIGLFHATKVFDGSSRQFAAALFMGTAMSITAFPVLARILTERNLQKTKLGASTIAAAAINDVAAWVILAFAIAVAHASGPMAGLRTAALSLVYAAILFFFVRPFLVRLEMVHERQGRLSQNVVAVIFLIVLASAWATEAIGIHAMFGAFLVGCVMPKGTGFVRHLTEKLEDYTVVFLLPIFFAYTGLKTQLGLIHGPALWLVTALIIAVACAGKFGGTLLPAKLFGAKWRDAIAMGVLMNTRGLVELVILTVGLQFGVINETVFAMMVVMALVTTFLTTPLLHWVLPKRWLAAQQAKLADHPGYTVLIPVASPRSGTAMLALADMISSSDEDRRVVALHLSQLGDRDSFRSGLREAESDEALQPMLAYAKEHKIPFEPLSFTSRDVAADIARVTRDRSASLVLIGFHRPVFSRAILGGTVHRVMTGADADVGVFVDRGLDSIKRVLVPYMAGPHDRLAIEIGARLARNTQAEVTILHIIPRNRGDNQKLDAQAQIDRIVADPDHPAPVHFRVVQSDSPVQTVIDESKDFDLAVIGVSDEWGLSSHLFGWRPERIANQSKASLLIVRKHATHATAAPAAVLAVPIESVGTPTA